MRLRKSIFVSESGMSLIQTMIAGAIMVGIALAIAQVVRNSATSLKRSESVSNKRRLIDRFHDISRGRVAITNTVNANSQLSDHVNAVSSPPLTNMALDPPSPLYPIELRDSGNTVVIPSGGLFLNREGAPCNPACDATNAYWIINSNFAAKAANDFEIITSVEQNPRVFVVGDPLYDPEAMRLKTELSSSASGTAGMSHWTLSGSRIENNNTGEVRVVTSFRNQGATNLENGLTVTGGNTSLTSTTITGTTTANGDATFTSPNFRVNGNTTLDGSVSILQGLSVQNDIASNANITGDRIFARNGIRIRGAGGATCNAANRGLVRLNASNELEYCDGGNWKSALGTSSEMSVQSSGSLPAAINFTKTGNAASSYIVVQGVHRISGYDTGGCSSPATFRIMRDGVTVATSVFDVWNNPDITISTGGRVNGLAAGSYAFTINVDFPSGSDCGGGIHRHHFLTVREVFN